MSGSCFRKLSLQGEIPTNGPGCEAVRWSSSSLSEAETAHARRQNSVALISSGDSKAQLVLLKRLVREQRPTGFFLPRKGLTAASPGQHSVLACSLKKLDSWSPLPQSWEEGCLNHGEDRLMSGGAGRRVPTPELRHKETQKGSVKGCKKIPYQRKFGASFGLQGKSKNRPVGLNGILRQTGALTVDACWLVVVHFLWSFCLITAAAMLVLLTSRCGCSNACDLEERMGHPLRLPYARLVAFLE